jgi:hypothetical protein
MSIYLIYFNCYLLTKISPESFCKMLKYYEFELMIFYAYQTEYVRKIDEHNVASYIYNLMTLYLDCNS